jgi:hypothetical protein
LFRPPAVSLNLYEKPLPFNLATVALACTTAKPATGLSPQAIRETPLAQPGEFFHRCTGNLAVYPSSHRLRQSRLAQRAGSIPRAAAELQAQQFGADRA